MTNGHGYTSSMRLSAWVNDINPVNWKTVLTGYMQLFAIAAFWLGWLADIVICLLRKQPTDFHETSVGLVLGFLAGLSGFTLTGRINDRKTDYGYIERINEGKRIEAATKATQVTVTGDSPNVTATMPVQPAPVAPPATPPPTPPAPTKLDVTIAGPLARGQPMPYDLDDDGVM